MNKLIVKTEGLKKYYRLGKNTVRALDGVDFSVKEKEFVAIIGRSGSGKSTLLHMIGGLDSPTEGEVYVDGKRLSGMNREQLAVFRRRKAGFIFQNYNLIPDMNVYDNIVLPVELDGKRIDQKFVKEILELLQLEEKLDALPGMLSGGQQQRVAIARALILEPDLLVLDEPTSMLDEAVKGEIMALLGDLAVSARRSFLMVTHDIAMSAALCQRLAVMEAGRIVEEGTSEKVLSHPETDLARRLVLAATDLPGYWRECREN